MPYWMVDGKQLTHEEYQEHKKGVEEEQERKRQEAARLVKELGEAYRAYEQFMEQNADLAQRVSDAEAREHELYQKLRQNLAEADRAPRCEKIREDGTMCGCPQMKGHNYCYAHERMLQARAQKLELPPQEDANSIQMALMLVQRALIDDEISEKKAGLLLYSLQIAATNVKNTSFCREGDDFLATELPDEELEGERAVRGRMVWTTKYEEEPTTEALTPASQHQACRGPQARRHGGEEKEGLGRRLALMSADSEEKTAQARVPVPHTSRAGQEPTSAGEGASTPPREARAAIPDCASTAQSGAQPRAALPHEPGIGMQRVSPLDIGMTGEGRG